ncbi:MAG: ankyrin repeat domain-containing protein [Wolbachia sp.]
MPCKERASVNLQDVDGMSPIHLAAKSGRLDIIQYLIGEEIDVNLKDEMPRIIMLRIVT